MGPLIPLILGLGGGYYLTQKAAQAPRLAQGPAQSDAWWNDWRTIGAGVSVALGSMATDRDTRESWFVIGAGLGGAAVAGMAYRTEAEKVVGGMQPQPQIVQQADPNAGYYRPLYEGGREAPPPAPSPAFAQPPQGGWS